jgi:dynein heavy chain
VCQVISTSTAEAETKQKAAQDKEAALSVESVQIAQDKLEAEQALAEAIPALNEAAEALRDLKKEDITEIRTFAKPTIYVQKVGGRAVWVLHVVLPAQLRGLYNPTQLCVEGLLMCSMLCCGVLSPALLRCGQVCECVVILKNLKDVSWAGAKAIMTDPGFLKSLMEFDKDSLTEKQVKRVKTDYLKDPNFTYENIRNASTAGAGEGLSTQCSACSCLHLLCGGWHALYLMSTASAPDLQATPCTHQHTGVLRTQAC